MLRPLLFFILILCFLPCTARSQVMEELDLYPLAGLNYSGRPGVEIGLSETQYLGVKHMDCYDCPEQYSALNIWSFSAEFYPTGKMAIAPRFGYAYSIRDLECIAVGGSLLYVFNPGPGKGAPVFRPEMSLQTPDWRLPRITAKSKWEAIKSAFRMKLVLGFNVCPENGYSILQPYQFSFIVYMDDPYLYAVRHRKP